MTHLWNSSSSWINRKFPISLEALKLHTWKVMKSAVCKMTMPTFQLDSHPSTTRPGCNFTEKRLSKNLFAKMIKLNLKYVYQI